MIEFPRRHTIFSDDWASLHDPALNGCHIGSAIVGGGMGLAGSIFGGTQAAKAQTDAAQSANRVQLEMFHAAMRQLRPYASMGRAESRNLMPWLNANNTNSPLNALVKLVMPGSNQSATLEQTPGYQFTRDMGIKATDNALASRGLAGPGGALSRGTADYVTGLSQQTWQNQIAALLNTFQGGAGAMQNMVNTGAGAAAAIGGNATQTGAQVGQNMIGAGNAQAAMFNGIGGAMGNAGNYFSNAMQMNKLIGLYGG